MPKQLLAIAGRQTMLRATLARVRPLCPAERTLIVTGREHAEEIRRQAVGVPKRNVIVEPRGRNTAPCIALAAEIVARRAGDATMMVLPADHVVGDVSAFRAAMRRAMHLAESEQCLVTLGVRPTYPERGYGYIEVGSVLDRKVPRAFWARGFHEKPDQRTAVRYVRAGRYLWNSGMFVWRANVIRREIHRLLPEVASSLRPVAAARTDRDRARAVERAYRRLRSISIDKGVMERAERIAVVEARFEWNDVGSWAAMPELWGTDRYGNAARGVLLPLESRRNIVFSPGRLVALLGVDDLVVVDSEDALLVCRRDRAQDVRDVVAELRRRGRGRHL